MTFRIVWLEQTRAGCGRIVSHIDAECTQHVRTQRRPAAMHADHHHNRPSLVGKLFQLRARQRPQQGGRHHTVVHRQTSIVADKPRSLIAMNQDVGLSLIAEKYSDNQFRADGKPI